MDAAISWSSTALLSSTKVSPAVCDPTAHSVPSLPRNKRLNVYWFGAVSVALANWITSLPMMQAFAPFSTARSVTLCNWPKSSSTLMVEKLSHVTVVPEGILFNTEPMVPSSVTDCIRLKLAPPSSER